MSGLDDKFGRDDEALYWARSAVMRVRDKLRDWEFKARDSGDQERMMRCRRIANVLEMELIGGEGCTITPFDWRRPTMLAALDRSSPVAGVSTDAAAPVVRKEPEA